MAEFKKLINPPIKASEINSESATNGQVLTANGTGGAAWQDPSGGGTEVVANPTLAGTESDLTGLEVAGTKYKVPSGGGGTQLHLHSIHIGTHDRNYEVSFSIYSSSSDEFDHVTLYELLYNKNFYVPGFILMTDTNKPFVLTEIKGRYFTLTDTFMFDYINENGDISEIELRADMAIIQDIVTPL